jgi:hypothetical protein
MMGMFWWRFTSTEGCPSGVGRRSQQTLLRGSATTMGAQGAEGVSLSRKRDEEKCYVMRPVPRKACLYDPRRARLLLGKRLLDRRKAGCCCGRCVFLLRGQREEKRLSLWARANLGKQERTVICQSSWRRPASVLRTFQPCACGWEPGTTVDSWMHVWRIPQVITLVLISFIGLYQPLLL